MRVVLTGGGTGGHIYPALALAKEIRAQHPDATFLYIGSEKGLEKEIVGKAGYPFQSISISGFKRALSFENVRTVYRFLKAVRVSKRRLTDFRPDVVIGTGGFVCGPVVYAASKMKIPTLIHEQNVIPGLTNKFLSRYADCVAVSFSGSKRYFPEDKVAVTGNPRATEVAQADRMNGIRSLGLPERKPIVLIVGGSRGARPINEAFLQMLPRIKEETNAHFVYVTGEAHHRTVMEKAERDLGQIKNVSIHPFLYNMPEVLAATDLIVNRAGASFLAEITSLGIPSILIPSPYVTNNHQEKNARWLEEQGASLVLLERELSGERLLNEIQGILRDDNRRSRMRQAARRLGEPKAAANVYREIRRLVENDK